jgi:hypothetical protein
VDLGLQQRVYEWIEDPERGGPHYSAMALVAQLEDTRRLAALALTRTLDRLSRRDTLQSMALAIVVAVETEVSGGIMRLASPRRLEELMKQSPARRQKVLEEWITVHEGSRAWTQTQRAQAGASRSAARLTFAGQPAERLGGVGDGIALMEAIFDRAAVLIAFEQVGGADKCLEMAKEYAMGRYAFGRTIAGYQAIKHKLADMYVKNELARSNAYYGAWALNTSAPELPIAASAARIAGCEAFWFAAKENVQTHGGMGFTWAFDCHLYYRRSNALALSLGSLSTWESLLIERMRGGNAAVA